MPLPESIVAQPDMQARMARYVMVKIQSEMMKRRADIDLNTTQLNNAKRALPGQVLAQNEVNKEQEKRQKEAEGGGFFGSGGGAAGGGALGLGIGALLALPTGGLSLAAGAALGGAIGGAGGAALDATFAPGQQAFGNLSNQTGQLGNRLLDVFPPPPKLTHGQSSSGVNTGT